MSTDSFYQNMSVVESFDSIFDLQVGQDVPDDWHIIITDVVSSTAAIEAGKYKEVNIAGGLATIAVTNAYGDMEFPFVFGGDGVTMLVPDKVAASIPDVLFDTCKQVSEMYDLKLRAGIVPVSVIRKAGHDLKLAKIKISDHYAQAVLNGSGVDFAEALVKSPEKENRYLIQQAQNPSIKADFSGFTCRWKDIPSTKGETIALIVKANQSSDPVLFNEILNQIAVHFGKEKDYHPLAEEALEVTDNQNGYLHYESQALGGKSFMKRLFFFTQAKIESFSMKMTMRFGIQIKPFWYAPWYDMSRLKDFQIVSSDFKKYDGTLKMIISGTSQARLALVDYLEGLYQSGKIYFGVHHSDRALMTCFLHKDSASEVHFVDSADGGYALAARQMKAQIKSKRWI